jgi:hypothetical protein
MNKIILTIAITASAFIGYIAGTHKAPLPQSTSKAQPHNPQIAQASSAPAASTANCPAQSLSDNPTVNANTQPVKTNAVTEDTASLKSEIDAIKTKYKIDKRSEDFADWLTKTQAEKPWFDLGLEMSERFKAEEKDYRWASNEEGNIQDMFYQNQALADIALKSTTCKSTQCQVVIGVTDQEYANDAAMTVSQALGSNKLTQIIIDNKIQQGETIFYVSRDEAGFEFN